MKFRKNTGYLVLSLFTIFLLAACGGGGGGGINSNPVPIAPTVVTLTVNTPSVDTALINGSVNPNGLEATAWFEYGTDSSLTNPTKIANQVMAAATVPQAINATLPSLSAGTKYYYRVVATNTVGTSKGTIESFTTTSLPPTVNTGTADPAIESAVINGTVNPNGLAVSDAHFEYGTDSTLTTFSTTSVQALAAGFTGQPITASLPGLTQGTTYYFRVSATNTVGTSKGTIKSFITTSTPPPIANAGLNQSVVVGQSVTLDGSGSSDPYGTITAYEWKQLSGTAVTLSTPTEASTTFTAPTVSYPSENLLFQLKVTDNRGVSGTDTANVDVEWGLLDDFSTDTTSSYQVMLLEGSAAAFVYDPSGQRVHFLSADDNHVIIAHSLPTTNQGIFSLDFSPIVKYPTGGGIWIRLMQDNNTYYEIQNFSWNVPLDPHPNTASVRKVIGGSEVQKKLFTNSYAQGDTYPIKITFSPSLTTVVAFGEAIVLDTNGTSIQVNQFDLHIGQQDAYVDNIRLEPKP